MRMVLASTDDPAPQHIILGVPVLALPWDEAIEHLHGLIDKQSFTLITWLNAHNSNLARENARFRQALDQFLVLPDGIGVDIAARLLHGEPFPDNLNGTDFTPALLRGHTNPLRIGLLGARRSVVEKAAENLKRNAPQHEYRVISDGFFNVSDEPRILQSLAEYHPHILLVAMGVPRQELFMHEKLTAQHCVLAFGVGALFDFRAGAVLRAPIWMQKSRLEWLYRFSQEPTRLWRRYVLGNPLFLLRVLRELVMGEKAGQ
ncbi:WecB/TagA/CpsF family glycosyltransferase [Phyllobacterium myrsinacearum]|uniref:Exopolysaccharide biosynthesis WecB/TagA/CpsF family protein n=1 Tax=Phyllobacterium myrsinacearum TaxID=28101 RepID=A0A839EK84_9HYPH|nr:WecB/TagA/CpsF family glycosyltransferase [Phyllobacterium myrsinacearum]MBA8877130.1 exopolysaccharide biosynthesis WecB/TagA/CpsF family protein [Phyllobacterium myrsinacearum]